MNQASVVCKWEWGTATGFVAVSCRDCFQTTAVNTLGWERARARIIDRGWRMSSAEDWLCPECVGSLKKRAELKRQAKAELEEREKQQVQVVSPPPLVFVVKRGSMLCPSCHKASEDLGAGKFRCDPCDKWFEV